ASRRLSDELKARHPEIPWLELARAGNFYRHYYERIVDQFVWDTVQKSLGPLLAVVEDELAKLKPE
ncbi:MAG TPA: HepT-like ribonuclease domain-containing protein, partial [Methyloceanibacter sp.]|nr:HepT-like ribonuclease domain-containing protein [Methyloceanibacter sp.]